VLKNDFYGRPLGGGMQYIYLLVTFNHMIPFGHKFLLAHNYGSWTFLSNPYHISCFSLCEYEYFFIHHKNHAHCKESDARSLRGGRW
jgi:hypothetical protein